MATTRTAHTHWEGPLLAGGKGNVTLDSSGLGNFDVSWAARTEAPGGPDQPRRAHRRGSLSVLFDGIVERAGEGRSHRHHA